VGDVEGVEDLARLQVRHQPPGLVVAEGVEPRHPAQDPTLVRWAADAKRLLTFGGIRCHGKGNGNAAGSAGAHAQGARRTYFVTAMDFRNSTRLYTKNARPMPPTIVN